MALPFWYSKVDFWREHVSELPPRTLWFVYDIDGKGNQLGDGMF